MKSGTAKRFWLSLAAGALAVGVGYIIPQFSEWVLMPGQMFIAPSWPEGIHSDFDSPVGVLAKVAVGRLGAWILWSALAFAITGLWRKQDRSASCRLLFASGRADK